MMVQFDTPVDIMINGVTYTCFISSNISSIPQNAIGSTDVFVDPQMILMVDERGNPLQRRRVASKKYRLFVLDTAPSGAQCEICGSTKNVKTVPMRLPKKPSFLCHKCIDVMALNKR